MAREINEIFKDIAASLWIMPATIEELSERDFLKFRSVIGVSNIIVAMVNLGWIYERGGKFFTYKKSTSRYNQSDVAYS